jgi:hypothetical protein
MKKLLALIVVLSTAAAFAQTPPQDDGAETAPAPKAKPHRSAPAASNRSIAEKLQDCLTLDDGTKDRLDCYDAVIPPKPKPNPPAAKGVMDCKFVKEQDERLTCFNGFAESIPKFGRDKPGSKAGIKPSK